MSTFKTHFDANYLAPQEPLSMHESENYQGSLALNSHSNFRGISQKNRNDIMQAKGQLFCNRSIPTLSTVWIPQLLVVEVLRSEV